MQLIKGATPFIYSCHCSCNWKDFEHLFIY